MKEVNSLFLFALDLNHELLKFGNNDIAAHPSCPTLMCKHCRVALVYNCKNQKCALNGPFISGNILPGHKWPEFACTGCKRPSEVLSLIPNCQQGCFSEEAKIDRDQFERLQEEHTRLFYEIKPVLSYVSFMCKEFRYDRVISALDMGNIENICKTVFSFWFCKGVTFEACVGFFGFAKELILHMHKLKHPLETDAMDVLSTFMKTNVAQYMADQNEWKKTLEDFFKTQKLSIENEMTCRLRGVDSELGSCLALKCISAKAFNIAVVGETGSGKSSLINALRGIRPGEEGAAGVGVTETTLVRSQYAIPYNENMFLTDLPGIGSVKMTEEMYLSIVEFAFYDFFILVSSRRITGRDIWFAQQIRNYGKAFFFVKTKIDIDIDNEIFDHGKSATETTYLLRKECEMEMKNIGMHDSEIFLVSSRKTNKADFGKLKAQLESGASIAIMSRVTKRNALMQTKRQTKMKCQEQYIKVANSLQVVAMSLDNESRNMKQLKVGTASVSLVCGITSSACILAAPATLGASLIPGIVLGVIAAASAFTTAGSSIFEHFRQKKKAKEMKDLIEREIETPCLDSDDALVEYNGSSELGAAETKEDKGGVGEVAGSTIEAIKGGLGVVTGSTIGITLRGIESGAVTTLSSMAKIVRLGGGIVGLVGVPFDVYTIVTQSMDLHKGNYSAVAKELRKKKKEIERKLFRSAYKRRCPNPERCAYICASMY
ncbi:IIGP1-like protein [Mya arenaria]|uniref:IIGP1-like protein n=1 Tax=Mya arenaria TaxID=6604 RepID=A0ABY7G4I1_MYAAR|nr:uncharacterized protein LOC128220372 [Mya arenaria]WAR28284.1 IIGP1-like protein [Mya arenaria]